MRRAARSLRLLNLLSHKFERTVAGHRWSDISNRQPETENRERVLTLCDIGITEETKQEDRAPAFAAAESGNFPDSAGAD